MIRKSSYVAHSRRDSSSGSSSRTQQIYGGGLERLYHRVGTKLYMPPELLDPIPTFHFDRINAYQHGDVYSLALVLWEIGHCACSPTHCRPYENQLPMNFTIDQLTELVCRERKRPLSGVMPSDKVRRATASLGARNKCLALISL